MRFPTAFLRGAVLLALAGTAALAGDPVLAWNEAFIRCVRREMPPPCLAARNLAILHVAMHLAVREAQAGNLAQAEIERAAAVFPTDPEIGSPLDGAVSLSPSGVANLAVGSFAAFSVDYGAGETLPGYSTTQIGVIPEPMAAYLLVCGLAILRAKYGFRHRIWRS